MKAFSKRKLVDSDTVQLIKNELESFVSCETTLYLLTAETWSSRARQKYRKRTRSNGGQPGKATPAHENVSKKDST